jgi:hypothetical protein
MRRSEASFTSLRWKNVLAGDTPSPDLFVRSSSLGFCARMGIIFGHGKCCSKIVSVFGLPSPRFVLEVMFTVVRAVRRRASFIVRPDQSQAPVDARRS